MRQQAQAEREALIRQLGVWGADTGFKLPERLPDLPKERPELQQIEAYALRNRLDIQAGKLRGSCLVTGADESHALHQRAGPRLCAQQQVQ